MLFLVEQGFRLGQDLKGLKNDGILLAQNLEARLNAEGHVLHLVGNLLLHGAEVGLPVLVGDGELLLQGPGSEPGHERLVGVLAGPNPEALLLVDGEAEEGGVPEPEGAHEFVRALGRQ